jgi:hypothetical protein
MYSGVVIPFEMNDPEDPKNKDYYKPYLGVIKFLQSERVKYPKGSFNNLFYKLMGNSLYGQICRGLSGDSVFDSRSGARVRMTPSPLTNPILGSYVTDLVRAVLSECINEASNRGGRIVSCTTDGFITDIPGLDLDRDFCAGGDKVTSLFKMARRLLSGQNTFLELKTSSKGIASWCTRGQLGLEINTNLKAMTGYQSKYHTHQELMDIVLKAFESGEKEIHYVQQSLRSGKDVFDDGGHVTPKLSEKVFRLNYDNRRAVDLCEYDGLNNPSGSRLLSTVPHDNIDDALMYNLYASLSKSKYASNTGYPNLDSRVKNYVELGLRQFVRGVTQKKFNVDILEHFPKYKQFIEYLGTLDLGFKVQENYIAVQKRREFIPHIVPRTRDTIEFVSRINKRFPDLDLSVLFKR